MNSFSEIGGYFEIELPRGRGFHRDAKALNTARNSFEYLLRQRAPKIVFMPKYMCDVMLEPLMKLGIKYKFYHVDVNLEIADDINMTDETLLVYVNYFGIKNTYSSELARKYKDNLILDCSQAFYFKDIGQSSAVYSPRKFFGVADGGYVSTRLRQEDEFDDDYSYERMSHLLKRADLGAEKGYADFIENDKSLIGQPILNMSTLTKRLLGSIDYEAVRQVRIENFNLLHENLGYKNQLVLDISQIDGPMSYPFLVDDGREMRKKLIDNKVYIPTYWPNVVDWCQNSEVEYQLAERVLALPIDQRYNKEDMQRIAEVIHES